MNCYEKLHVKFIFLVFKRNSHMMQMVQICNFEVLWDNLQKKIVIISLHVLSPYGIDVADGKSTQLSCSWIHTNAFHNPQRSFCESNFFINQTLNYLILSTN